MLDEADTATLADVTMFRFGFLPGDSNTWGCFWNNPGAVSATAIATAGECLGTPLGSIHDGHQAAVGLVAILDPGLTLLVHGREEPRQALDPRHHAPARS
jgi:hypothetical protein